MAQVDDARLVPLGERRLPLLVALAPRENLVGIPAAAEHPPRSLQRPPSRSRRRDARPRRLSGDRGAGRALAGRCRRLPLRDRQSMSGESNVRRRRHVLEGRPPDLLSQRHQRPLERRPLWRRASAVRRGDAQTASRLRALARTRWSLAVARDPWPSPSWATFAPDYQPEGPRFRSVQRSLWRCCATTRNWRVSFRRRIAQ